MEVSSAPELCLHLISSAYERCRVSGTLCRLSVVVKQGHPPPILHVFVSDTGVGSCLEEFKKITCLGLETWDGSLQVKTTGKLQFDIVVFSFQEQTQVCEALSDLRCFARSMRMEADASNRRCKSIRDTEVYCYHLNLRQYNSGKRLIRLPSIPKNGAIFSGTEVSLSILESIQVIVAEIKSFFRKMQILKIADVAVEMVVEHEDVQGSQIPNLFLSNEDDQLSDLTSSIERLKSGLEDYVLKHGNLSSEKCKSCFVNWGPLKAGIGTVHSKETKMNSGLTVEVVIIIAQLDLECSSSFTNNLKTEVLYFKDFKICPIPDQSLKELTSIDWKSYGLSLATVSQEGCNFIEWASLPPGLQISMVVHCYQKQITPSSSRQKTHAGRHLVKRAVKLALSDLKEKHAGILLSAHAIKTLSYAPDLARSIAELILSSNDNHFQEECFSLLGLQSGETGDQSVEDSIKERLVSVIKTYDRKSMRNKETASFLFEDDFSEDSNLQDFGYEQGEDSFMFFEQ